MHTKSEYEYSKRTLGAVEFISQTPTDTNHLWSAYRSKDITHVITGKSARTVKAKVKLKQNDKFTHLLPPTVCIY